ncbi:MAG TPA: hypothetical protein PLF26_13600, partial [Blastocatellia bacterium]|nr:hypothetical protein [Blastocatellia bacterium]
RQSTWGLSATALSSDSSAQAPTLIQVRIQDGVVASNRVVHRFQHPRPNARTMALGVIRYFAIVKL